MGLHAGSASVKQVGKGLAHALWEHFAGSEGGGHIQCAPQVMSQSSGRQFIQCPWIVRLQSRTTQISVPSCVLPTAHAFRDLIQKTKECARISVLHALLRKGLLEENNQACRAIRWHCCGAILVQEFGASTDSVDLLRAIMTVVIGGLFETCMLS